MSVGRNIKRLRLEAGISTLPAFAERLGVTDAQLSDWENDRYVLLRVRTLVRIAKVLRCSVDDLLVGVDPEYDRARRVVRLPSAMPVVAEGEASPGDRASDDPGGQRSAALDWMPRPVDVSDPHAYGVRIRRDSMVPAYRPDMIAIVSPRCLVRDGDEVYVGLASGEWLVRLARPARRGCMLEPYNLTHPPRFSQAGRRFGRCTSSSTRAATSDGTARGGAHRPRQSAGRCQKRNYL